MQPLHLTRCLLSPEGTLKLQTFPGIGIPFLTAIRLKKSNCVTENNTHPLIFFVSIYQLRKMTIQMHLTGLTPVALSIYDLL